jgi:hypothetical protein
VIWTNVTKMSGEEPVRESPFAPTQAGTAGVLAPQIKGENKVTINRDLSYDEVKELSVCEEFKTRFEECCMPSWVRRSSTGVNFC